jgi:hypothetical protein
LFWLFQKQLIRQISMINRPIHENLDTSFVNLSALIRFLRRRNFVGKVNVQLNNYEAEVVLDEGNRLKVREHDQSAGRIAEGEEALQRLLVRSREAGGTINVYQFVEENSPVIAEVKTAKIEFEAGKVIAEVATNGNGNGLPKVAASPIKMPSKPLNVEVAVEADKQFQTKNAPSLPNFPFNLSNSVEQKAKLNGTSPQDWQTILQLTSELLWTVDTILAEANLNFSAAIRKAQSEISTDYPFFDPNDGVFKYENGKVTMEQQVSGKLYVAGLNEILRRMLDKLGTNAKFHEVHRQTTQRLIALIRQRKPHYDKFSITPQLEKILGI